MKKLILSIILIVGVLSTAGCSNEETSSVSETKEPSIYVERDDLLYGDDDSSEPSQSESTPSESSNPEEKPAPDQSGGAGGGAVPSTTQTSGDITAPEGTLPDLEEPDESIYNTTVEQIIEDMDVSFGKIYITHYSPDYADTENAIFDEEAENNPRIGIGREFVLGDNSYGFYRDNLLAVNGATFIDDPFKVSIQETPECPYAFSFVGAGHYLAKADKELGSNFWLELERDGAVLTHTGIKKISAAGGYSVAVKGIAVKLGDFDAILSSGSANYKPQVSLKFIVTVDGKEHDISVGMPYQSLVDILGEGTEMTGELVIDEETGKTEDVTYYVYKTADYTLIIEKQDYPDIKPKEVFVEEYGVSEETVLIKTIFLIKNEAELPPLSEE